MGGDLSIDTQEEDKVSHCLSWPRHVRRLEGFVIFMQSECTRLLPGYFILSQAEVTMVIPLTSTIHVVRTSELD
jgi:hypothetical protein